MYLHAGKTFPQVDVVLLLLWWWWSSSLSSSVWVLLLLLLLLLLPLVVVIKVLLIIFDIGASRVTIETLLAERPSCHQSSCLSKGAREQGK